jgi:chromosome segregation ATPase
MCHMLERIKIFSAEQAAELKSFEERQWTLKSRASQIEDRRGEGLRANADRKIGQCASRIKDIERSQNPSDDYYIINDADRAANLERKAPLEAERDQAQAEVDALKLEQKEIEKHLNELDAERAPLEVLKEIQDKLNKNWPMIVASESILKIAAEIGPDLIVAAIAPLFDAYMDSIDKLEPQLARQRKQNTKAFKADFDAFMEAGFTSAKPWTSCSHAPRQIPSRRLCL